MRAVITVIGNDCVGIIANVSRILSERNVNILDISQTIMQNMFTMIMLVDLQGADMKNVSDELQQLAAQMGLSIHVQNEELFQSMHRI